MRLRLLPIIAAGAILAYGLALARFSHAGFPDRLNHGQRLPFISDKPLGEDAFYMIAIGWNLGTGRGFTYGGAPTTGTQPLMTLVYGAVASIVHAAGGDRWTMTRAALAFNVLLFVVFADVVYRLARIIYPTLDSVSLSLTSAAVALFNATLFRLFTYGLETGLYLLCAAVCVFVSLRVLPRPSWRGAIALGAAAGVTALARIDFAVVFALFVGAAVLRRRVPVAFAAIMSATGAAITLPWLVWVHAMSGRWMPSSGESQFGLIGPDAGRRLIAVVRAVSHNVSPWFYPDLTTGVLPASPLLLAAVEIVLIAVAVVVYRARTGVDEAGAREVLRDWTAAVAALLAIYVLAFWPTYFYPRYFALLSVLALPHLTAGLTVLCRTRRVVLATCMLLAVGFAATLAVTLHRGRTGNALTVTAHYIGTNVDPQTHVGAFSSGASGYFFDNVVNLDGKVNGAAMAARRAGNLPAYVEDAGLRVIADWPETMELFMPGHYLTDRWRPCDRPFPPDAGVCLEHR